MANVKKYTTKQVSTLLRHNTRDTLNPSNKDINPARTHLNYRLSPEWKFLSKTLNDYEKYKLRLSQLHVYNRADVKTVAGWIVTAPKCLEADKHGVFFQEVYKFLEARYGRANTIQAIVHDDETTPHLHFLFIPVVKNAKNTGNKNEKVCANEVLTRQELREFHPALQEHLKSAGVNAKILNGATAAGNRTVAEMKKERNQEHIQEKKKGIFLER
jgi:hypothetical protein